ncbi:MAG TPA: TetR/AcrR family transcriptional regulator [Anaerovoracaceae bacterium]|nr:TetR/AcrR family transcriptional regulator [Anaerovoracaceae bacterium]
MKDTMNEAILDKRCRKTRKAIKTSLIKIMSEKDISDITITEIAEEADINRKTFYAHYKDLYDILDEIENDLITKLFHILDSADILKSMYNPYPLFKELTNEINKDFEFYRLLVQSKNYNSLLNKIQGIFKERFLELTKDTVKLDRETLSFIIDFISSGITSVYKEWFRSERDISLEQLSKALSMLIGNGLNSVLEKK